MKMNVRKLIATLAATALLATAFAGCSSAPAPDAAKPAADAAKPAADAAKPAADAAKPAATNYKITLITMDSMDEHWLKVKAGAEAAAKELGNVDLTFDAPQTKVDATVQAQLVENAITNKVNAIMLAPLDKQALVPVVNQAKEAGIAVIIIDSAVGTDKYDAFFSTDNGAAAKTAADELAKLIGDKGKVAIVNAQAGSGTTMLRENAFKEQIAAAHPNIEIVGTQYSDGDKQKALNYATDFMTQYSDLAGFYATNEGSSVGVGNAIDQMGKIGTVKSVGFDFSADTKALIEKGALDATMVQNPFIMGEKGLKTAVEILSGKAPAQKDFDTGVAVVTKENVANVK